MRPNVFAALAPRRRPRGRAAAALLPGVFALLLAGVSGVAAAAPTPSPTPTASPSPTPRVCHHGTKPDGTCCPRWNPCLTSPTPSPSPSPSSTPTGSGGSSNGGNNPPTPTPTSTPKPTPKPTPSSGSGQHSGGSSKPGGSASSSSGGSGGSGGSAATRVQVPTDPSPFGALTGAVDSLTAGAGLDAASIPPVEALTPVSGLDFGDGLDLGPLLLLIDLIGIGVLAYLVRTRWMASEA